MYVILYSGRRKVLSERERKSMQNNADNPIYLQIAKRVAIAMLETEYKVHKEYDGLFVTHPYINSTVLIDEDGLYDIRKYPERYNRFKTQLEQHINKCTSIERILYIMQKTYRIQYLYLLVQYNVPVELCGNLLGSIWVALENNDLQPPDIRKVMHQMLNASDYTRYTTVDDQNIFKNLPERIKIYRGAQLGEPKRGFSWSVDRNVAVWFAKRFNATNPVVHTATISKKYVYFYTNAANEQEVVVDYTHINRVDTEYL